VSTTLILFDIDGTLIQTARAGQRSLAAAIEALYGRTVALDGIPVAGRTDLAILRDVFARLDLAWDTLAVEALREAYFDQLARTLAATPTPPPGDFGVLPGVPRILRTLESDPSAITGLLTGNLERGASIKLGHFGLWDRFRIGAFGDAHIDRRDLVPVALSRAASLGVVPSSVVIVGDTPLDVDCAHAHGAVAVAVATGQYGVAELEKTGADVVVPTLESLDASDLTQLTPSRADN
jgi:phosphoglycolate phosphatase-like HAD superfamily hydrolase